MRHAHLTAVQRAGDRQWRATCLCGWSYTAKEWAKHDAKKEAKQAAVDHWLAQPLETDLADG
jgi:hypothetical protein